MGILLLDDSGLRILSSAFAVILSCMFVDASGGGGHDVALEIPHSTYVFLQQAYADAGPYAPARGVLLNPRGFYQFMPVIHPHIP